MFHGLSLLIDVASQPVLGKWRAWGAETPQLLLFSPTSQADSPGHEIGKHHWLARFSPDPKWLAEKLSRRCGNSWLPSAEWHTYLLSGVQLPHSTWARMMHDGLRLAGKREQRRLENVQAISRTLRAKAYEGHVQVEVLWLSTISEY